MNQMNIRVMTVLASLGLLAACATENDNAASTGGATGMGGATGTGGASGAGGANVGTGTATTGGGLNAGGGVGLDCTAADTMTAPAGGLIADFGDADGGVNTLAARFLAFPIGSTSAPTYTTTNGALHITVNTPATADSQYLGVVIAFGYTCVDATAFSGVQFSISGSFSGCEMRYATCDVEHQDVTSGARHATGPAGAYQPQYGIAANQVTSTVNTLKVPFSGQSGGSPATPIDQSKLILALWQFDIAPAAGTAPSSCVADITVDDVRFY